MPPKKTVKKSRQSSRNRESICPSLTLSCSVVIIVVCAVVFQLLDRPEKQSKVQHLLWKDNKTDPQYMTQWLSHQAVPIVLTNTPFNEWKSAKWTLKSLSENTQLKHVLSKRSSSNVFKYFAVDQPLANIDFMNTEKDYMEIVYPREKFFEILSEPFNGYYYYSSGGIELLDLEDDIFPKNSLQKLTFPAHRDGLGQVNYWFGNQNVTAYTHYDTSHNLHMIVRGRKKFILFPPSAHKKMQLYSCLHQFYRQVFTDIFEEEEDLIETLGGSEVELKAGEVLYIPPYWFHSVVTMETTISLNVWSHSEVYLTMEDIYVSPIPFEAEWGKQKLMRVLNFFIFHLVKAVLKVKETAGSLFISETVYSRYRPLVEKACAEEFDRFLVESTALEYCLTVPIEELVSGEELEHIHAGIAGLVEQFKEIKEKAVLEINLGNYIEHLALRILGEEDILTFPFYLANCF